MKTILMILGLILFTSCSGVNEQIGENKADTVKKRLDLMLSDSDTPGIQYIVLDSNSFIFDYAGGWADIKNKKPMNSNTTMAACSMTKTLTAAAVLQLVESGKVDLDKSIDNYINNSPYGSSVTVRHLLAQTSGIPDPIPLRWVHLASRIDKHNEKKELEKVLKEHPDLDFTPGEKYSYSNISYWLLGFLIEKVSRQSYSEYMRDNIFTPLGLSNNEMCFSISDYKNHATGYLAKYSFLNMIKGFLSDSDIYGEYDGSWLRINKHFLNGQAFGGIMGSCTSFGKFLQDQLKNHSALLNNKSMNLFYEQQISNSGESVEMSLGWHIGQLSGIKYYFKQGGGAGFRSEMRIYPDQVKASVVIVNKTSLDSEEFLNENDSTFLND